MRPLRITALFILLGSATAGFAPDASAENTAYATIIIDSATIQPVGTGLVPASTDDNFVLLVESGHRLSTVTTAPYSEGWFDPQGATRLSRATQPMPSLPYGCLLGTFDGSLSAGFFLPNQSDWETQIAEVGDELEIGLNMSDADLALLEGQVVVHVLMITSGSEESGTFAISAATTLPLATGIFAQAGDEFIVLAKGLQRVPGTGTAPYSNGGFGPEGHSKLFVSGQIQPTAPYGCLLGSFAAGGNMTGGFRIANGGTWETQALDVGSELWLDTNMSAADHANAQGLFQITVIRIPDPATAVENPAEIGSAAKLLGSAPNPARDGATISYALARAGAVRLRVYDASGRWVRTLVDETQSAGEHEVRWDARDESGHALPSGTYFYQLGLGDRSETRKVSIVN